MKREKAFKILSLSNEDLVEHLKKESPLGWQECIDSGITTEEMIKVMRIIAFDILAERSTTLVDKDNGKAHIVYFGD